MRALTISLLVALTLVASLVQAEDRLQARSDPLIELGLEPSVPVRREASQSLALQQLAACCKTCRKGKACGDSCIQRTKTCHKPPGCACDAK